MKTCYSRVSISWVSDEFCAFLIHRNKVLASFITGSIFHLFSIDKSKSVFGAFLDYWPLWPSFTQVTFSCPIFIMSETCYCVLFYNFSMSKVENWTSIKRGEAAHEINLRCFDLKFQGFRSGRPVSMVTRPIWLSWFSIHWVVVYTLASLPMIFEPFSSDSLVFLSHL